MTVPGICLSLELILPSNFLSYQSQLSNCLILKKTFVDKKEPLNKGVGLFLDEPHTVACCLPEKRILVGSKAIWQELHSVEKNCLQL